MLWSILVPTIPGRRQKRAQLLELLERLTYSFEDVEVLVLEDNRRRTIGAKRNALLDIAKGHWRTFVDDDDLVSEDYVSALWGAMVGAVEGTACVTFQAAVSGFGHLGLEDGVATFGKDLPDRTFANKYERMANHLCAWRASDVRFPDSSHGEDFDYAFLRSLHAEGLSEVHIPRVLYFYRYDKTDHHQVWSLLVLAFLR